VGRALLIHRGGLGDFVLTFPLLQALSSSGFAERLLITRPSHGELAKHLSLCESALSCDSGPGFRLLSQEPAGLGEFDLILAAVSDADRTFERFLKNHLKAEVRVFFPEPANYLRHQEGRPPEYPDLWRGQGRVLLHPGSGSPKKNYPAKEWLGLYERLADAEFLLGPVELEQGLAWPGKPVVPEGLVQLSEALMEAKRVVSHDSGVAHLSAWLGTPTIALFKSTDPAVWAPRGKRASVISGGPGLL